jgi:hypothetical protein
MWKKPVNIYQTTLRHIGEGSDSCVSNLIWMNLHLPPKLVTRTHLYFYIFISVISM